MNSTTDFVICEGQSGWPIVSDGFFRSKITEQLVEDGIPEEAVCKIFDNAANILSNCPNPYDDTPDSKTGIVIGKVQSGKTSNFISLIALAFDNQYEIVVVLGGNKKILLEQNTKRIRSYFQNVDRDRLDILATNQNESILNAETIKRFINEKRKVIVVGLKGAMRINTISRIFSDPYLSTVPTLVIDDEGDQATLNTNVYKESMSATYEAVTALKGHLQRHCFLSVTATPQANILINTCDQLSPDFGVLIYPGDAYCGLEEFHGENQNEFIKVIPENEPSILDDAGLPQSFYHALATFFVGGAIRMYRGKVKNHAMLVHPSQRKYDHKIVLRKIDSLMRDWRERAKVKLDGIEDISYASLKRALMEAYDNLLSDGVQAPAFSELESLILQCIYRCSDAHLCNSDEDASENSKHFCVNIFVGGNMVERGLTISGLAVTYIVRRARGISNVDNTEQRARWFGYKRDFLDVCRVFTTQSITDDFSSILEHDDDLWSTIERAQLNGKPFKEIPRVFKLANQLLRMTRPNVAKTKRLDFSEWNKQDRLLLDAAKVSQNDQRLLQYRHKHGAHVDQMDFPGVNKHAILRDMNFADLKREVLQHWNFPTYCSIDVRFFDTLAEALIKSNISAKVDVVWMRDKEHETRSIREDGMINQLFQGRNSTLGNAAYYPGDSSIVTSCDVMQLQIHHIRPRNRPEIEYYSPTLALYIPSTYADQIATLVGQA